jgi:hypothetical protein
MSPLLYVLLRRIKNGVVRSFKTPVRAFMTVLLGGYFVFAGGSFFSVLLKPMPLKTGITPMNPDIAYAIITLAHLILLFYVIPSPKYMVQMLTETDIANIYPAPLDRWRVIRFFLLTKTFLTLFFLIGVSAVYIPFLLRVLMPSLFVSVVLQHQTMWVIGYVFIVLTGFTGMMLWRIVLDLRCEFGYLWKYTFRTGMTLFLGILLTSIGYHIGSAISTGAQPLLGLSVALDSWPLVLLLAPFKLFANLFLNRIDLHSIVFWCSIGFWIALCATGYIALRSQKWFLYEYAFQFAVHHAQMMARMRNPALLTREKVGKGKNVLGLPWFIRKLTFQRAGAFFWRDLIIAWRSFGMMIKSFCAILLLGIISSWCALSWYHIAIREKSFWVFSALTMLIVIMPFTIISVMHFSGILRKADVQKPIPVSAIHAVRTQILAWSLLTSSVIFLPTSLAMLLFHQFWYILLFILLSGCSMISIAVSAYYWVTLYNPDQEDPIQRMYASLFGFLLSLAAWMPGAAVVGISKLLQAPLFLVLVLFVTCNLAVTWFIQYLAARKYVHFVPTE